MFLSIFRRYAFKKIFDEKNLVFIIKVNMSANFKNFSTFSYKNIKIMLCRVFIFFQIHYLEEFFFLKFINHDLIHQKNELSFKKFNDFNCFRFFHFFKKFDSLSFLFELIEFNLQNRIIEFFLHDFYRFHNLIFKDIRNLIHRFRL